MNAARPEDRPAEPILLTEATLEHVLDVFLPEDPDAVAAGSRARSNAADPTDELFASERAGASGPELIAANADPPRPWRTYQTPGDAATAPPGDAISIAARSPSSGRIRTWTIAAGVVIGLAAVSAIAVQRSGRPASIASVERQPIPEPAAASSARANTADAPPATPATLLIVRGEIARDSRDAVPSPSVAGAVLKGSLTPDPLPAAPPEPAAPPLLDAVRATLPLDAPVASAPPMAAEAARAEPAPEPPPAPVVEPPPPPPTPLPTPAPPAVVAPVVNDTASIETVLGRYRSAFKALDAGAARAVWPAVDARALGRAFDQLVEQQLDFQRCDIVVTSTRATADCGGRARYVPKVGNRSLRDEPRQWTFTLQKVNDQWQIERVASR